ncbi:Microtubule-associated protein TORTIFOLIA1 [Striga hermonthica]|uniref:Microtubule-associated protein TORTIFOLIA1 n=1 Tax=Striga hermonthica TaxID=68872 RepID=A0A9N7R6J7_STRHE|nr:Microtubule-associated protein TORTIFOLIA1 [Striga hermonthica]
MSSQRSSKPPNQTAAPRTSSSSLASHLAMVELKQRILTSLSKLSDRDTHQIALEDLETIILSLSSDGVPMLLNCLYDAAADPKPAVKKEGVRLLAVLCANNKAAQGGAALCLAKMVECASDPPLNIFQKLCTRVCKYLNSTNFTAKASLLQVVSSLSQVGAISQHSLEPLLQSIHGCLSSADWATRKAAADTLIVISSNSGNITAEVAVSTLNALEASRFDKVKPVRESMTEALQTWKKLCGKGDGSSDENKASFHYGDNSESGDPSNRKDLSSGDRESAKSVNDSPHGSSPTDSNSIAKGNNILDKAVGILKKKAPGLTDKELNPEFFQKLETRVSDDLPVEVVLPRRSANPSNPQNEELQSNADQNGSGINCQADDGASRTRQGSRERRDIGDYNNRDTSNAYPDFSRTHRQPEGFMNNKGNWMAIQKQLLLLERQQAHLMNMLQVNILSGPSARCVWQASKDEATLEAIRVAGEDNGVSRVARRVANIPERTAEALRDDDDGVQERDPVWTAWSNAMEAFDNGDMDTAFAEVLSTCDDVLLMKLMDRSGPVLDQLSGEVANEVLNAISQLLITDHNFYDMFLYWIQQLADIVMANDPDVLVIPTKVKRDILLNLHEASSLIELPEGWDGSPPNQLLIQLASAWEINLENFGK